jgi:Tfp pilus assembly protein PilF
MIPAAIVVALLAKAIGLGHDGRLWLSAALLGPAAALGTIYALGLSRSTAPAPPDGSEGDRAIEWKIAEQAEPADPLAALEASLEAVRTETTQKQRPRRDEIVNPSRDFARRIEAVRREHDRAQELSERAIAADPNNATYLGAYAIFLTYVRRDYDRAQELFERAIAADPNNAIYLDNYAIFLTDVRREHDRAQELYERAIAADPNNAHMLGSYAIFLTDVRREHDRARELFERAIAADPNNAHVLGSYAIFLKNVRREHDRAQELYERAIAADPNNANNLGNYAIFLTYVRRDYDRAQELYERTIAADPNNANNLGNYARLLLERHQDARAFALIDRALKASGDSDDSLRAELWLYLAALGPDDLRDEALSSLGKLVDAGVRSPGWNVSGIVARAEAEGHVEMRRLAQLADELTSAPAKKASPTYLGLVDK